jgi:DNA replication protein DnaC
MDLDFIKIAMNIVLCGPNGVGKSTIAKNIANNAVIKGFTALFVTASQMLNDLASQDGDNALRRKFQSYEKPDVLIIDEVGYLSYSNRHADLLFEIISRRYQKKPVIITTNKPFSQWNDIFPGAACCVSLIDRLVHQSEIIGIEAESYRLKEAKEQSAQRNLDRQSKRKSKKTAENSEKIPCERT